MMDRGSDTQHPNRVTDVKCSNSIHWVSNVVSVSRCVGVHQIDGLARRLIYCWYHDEELFDEGFDVEIGLSYYCLSRCNGYPQEHRSWVKLPDSAWVSKIKSGFQPVPHHGGRPSTYLFWQILGSRDQALLLISAHGLSKDSCLSLNRHFSALLGHRCLAQGTGFGICYCLQL